MLFDRFAGLGQRQVVMQGDGPHTNVS